MVFGDIYRDRRVMVLGHTGFKGSWMYTWLEQLGAVVCGYALAPSTTPCHVDSLTFGGRSVIADIRDLARLMEVMQAEQPEIVFHLAAQPSVLASYRDPLETFSTNVLGTANVLEAALQVDSMRAVVVVTTDKCYENKEWLYPYRETDRLGGHDPYSASKACAEIVTASYRKSFAATTGKLFASARAGNVLGGGDWTADRLLPDVMRAAAAGRPVGIRNPGSTRPWQHVLEPLSGYLRLGQVLLAGDASAAEAWNFGPDLTANLTTVEVVELARVHWSRIRPEIAPQTGGPHEAGLLMLDSSKSALRLGWWPVWDIVTTVRKTVEWYRDYYERQAVLTSQQLDAYMEDAVRKGASWAT